MTDTNIYGVKTTHRKQFGALTFETRLLPAGEAVDLLPVLIALASGPGGVVLDVLRSALAASDLASADVSGASVRDGLLALSREIVAQGGSGRVRQMLAHTDLLMASGARVSVSAEFDDLFRGRPALVFEVLGWVLEVNFAPLDAGGQRPALLSRLTQWGAKLQQAFSNTQAASTSAPETGSGSGSRAPGA